VKTSLSTLLVALRDHGHAPFEWVLAHAPDGGFQKIWDANDSAATLLGVYAFAGDHHGLVRAGAACVRAALKTGFTRAEEPVRVTLEAVERWLRGAATIWDVEAVWLDQRGGRGTSIFGAMDALVGVVKAPTQTWAPRVAANAAYAIAQRHDVDDASFEQATLDAMRFLAVVVHRELPVAPTLQQLTAR